MTQLLDNARLLIKLGCEAQAHSRQEGLALVISLLGVNLDKIGKHELPQEGKANGGPLTCLTSLS